MKRQKHEARNGRRPDSDRHKAQKEYDATIASSPEPDDLEEALYGTFPASDPVAWESQFTAGRPSKKL